MLAARDSLVRERDEPETSGPTLRGCYAPNDQHPATDIARVDQCRIFAREMTRVLESFEIRSDRCRVRSALVARAIYLQRMVVDERAIRTNNGIGWLESVWIGCRRVDPVAPRRPYSVMTQF
jgi:hypothetical protein